MENNQKPKTEEKPKKKVNVNLILVLLILVFSSILGVEIYMLLSKPKTSTQPVATTTETSQGSGSSSGSGNTSGGGSSSNPGTGGGSGSSSGGSSGGSSGAGQTGGNGNVNQNSVMRNKAMKNDVKGFITSLSNYQSNNRGKIPTNDSAWESFISDYFTPFLNNNSSEFGYRSYEYVYCDNTAKGGCVTKDMLNDSSFGKFFVTTHASCYGDDIKYAASNTSVAVLIMLLAEVNGEPIGSFCVSN